MKKLDENILRQKYLEEKLTPVEISKELGCDHKTVRKYLRLYEIPLRTASEYNYLPRKSHVKPSDDLLFKRTSIMAHVAYLCEGWHTENTTVLSFCNTDPLLINLFIDCLTNTYQVTKIHTSITAKTLEEASILLKLYPLSKVIVEPTRVTPLVRVRSGGSYLASDFVENCYRIIFSKE